MIPVNNYEEEGIVQIIENTTVKTTPDNASETYAGTLVNLAAAHRFQYLQDSAEKYITRRKPFCGSLHAHFLRP